MTERDVVGDTIENHRIVKRCIKNCQKMYKAFKLKNQVRGQETEGTGVGMSNKITLK